MKKTRECRYYASLDTQVYLPNVDPPEKAVLDGKPDNEFADEIFEGIRWPEVDVDLLLDHPTSVWFLSLDGLNYYLPSIITAVRSDIAEGDGVRAVELFDHTVNHFSRSYHLDSGDFSRGLAKELKSLNKIVDSARDEQL